MDVKFISFEDVKRGALEGVNVVINAGRMGDAWSGGDAWKDAELVAKLTELVAKGGAFIGVGEPSAVAGYDTTLRMAHVLGIDEDRGERVCHGRWSFDVDKSLPISVHADALKANPNAKLLYTIPSFQNPTGITATLEKRKKVYALACKYNIAILEDNPYGELRFAGEDVPTIKSMDTEGRVLYAGSFSKVMAPAFRLGFLVFDKSLTMPLTVAKQTTDVHSNVLFQYVCNEYMTRYDFAAHLESARRVYRDKCQLMLDTMRRTFHPAVTFTQPEGGLFVMAFLPEGMDAQPFVREAIGRGVLCVPGSAFLADESRVSNGLRLNYSTPTDEQIVKGIEILGKLTHEWIKE